MAEAAAAPGNGSADAFQLGGKPNLTLVREVSGHVSPEIVRILSHLVSATHPKLPPVTVETIAKVVGQALESTLPPLDPARRKLLVNSIRLSRAEIANLPFEKSRERLEWSLDSLQHQARKWGLVFSALTRDGLNVDARSAALSAKSHLRNAVMELYEGDASSAEGVLLRIEREIDSAQSYYFAPEFKFPLSARAEKELSERLRVATREAKQRIKRRLSRLDGRRVGSEQIKKRMSGKLRRAEAYAIFTVIHRAFKSAVPVRVAVTYPAEYQQIDRDLKRRYLALREKELAASRQRDHLEEFQMELLEESKPIINGMLDELMKELRK